MQIVIGIGVLVLAYIIGSIPFGWLIVKMKTGKDIRVIESGRTGGTNAMRAAGFWAGMLTAIMDILKVHPYMIIKGSVVHNPFFIPPEEYLAKK